MKAKSVADVIAGEATSGTREERWADMVAIASVIKNRADQLGVPVEDVIASSKEFNAYNKSLPPGAENYVPMAQEAMDYVTQNGPVNNATFYATPSATDGLPNGLTAETETAGHQFFSDPQARSIRTAQGFKMPNVVQAATDTAKSIFDTGSGLLSDATDAGKGLLGPTIEAAKKLGSPVTNAVSGLPGLLSGNGVLNYAHPNQATGLAPEMRDVLDSVSTASGDPLDITSAYRSPSYNANIGGARKSYHTRGLASDIDMTGMTEDERSQLVDRMSERGVGGMITYANEPNMLHVDLRPQVNGEPRMMFNKTSQQINAAPDWFKAKALAMNDPNTYPSITGVEAAPILPVDTAPMPTLLNRDEMQINQPNGVMAAINPPMDNSVVRQGLPPAPSISTGWQDMAQAGKISPAVDAINAQMAPNPMPSYGDLASRVSDIQFDAAQTLGPRTDQYNNIGQYSALNTQLGAQLGPTTSPGLLANTPQMAMTSYEAPRAMPDVPAPSIQGPASTQITQAAPVQRQQIQQPVAPAPAPKATGLLDTAKTALNDHKFGLLGGLLGGLPGGVAGLLADYVSNNPGALGSFQNQPMTINNLGTGMAAMQGVYGPSAQRGNQFTASNGATVTSLGNGDVSYTNSSGVREVHKADGSIQSVW